ncbi:hypothetical protein BH20ACT11_BH20ACT11_00720 [soil metagenome]
MGARFELGRVVATPGALEALEASGVSPAELLGRHQSGDWGEVPAEDAKENERSVRDGFRLLSSYSVRDAGQERIWIITEADRSSTCLLLPSEY